LILMLVVGGFSLATRLMLWNFEKRWE
jgi:hypothetical protein